MYTIRNLEEMRVETFAGSISHSIVQGSFWLCNWGGIKFPACCLYDASFRGYKIKMLGQKYIERCTPSSVLSKDPINILF